MVIPRCCWADMKGLTIQVLKGRRFMMFASLLIMNTAGLSYIFGLYSNDIKSSLGYDQTTLNLISFYKDLGANIGILAGLINEVTPPWVVLAMGASFNFFGYFMIWLSVTKRIAKPHVWQMCLYICLGSNSQPFVNSWRPRHLHKELPRKPWNRYRCFEGLYGSKRGSSYTVVPCFLR